MKDTNGRKLKDYKMKDVLHLAGHPTALTLSLYLHSLKSHSYELFWLHWHNFYTFIAGKDKWLRALATFSAYCTDGFTSTSYLHCFFLSLPSSFCVFSPSRFISITDHDGDTLALKFITSYY